MSAATAVPARRQRRKAAIQLPAVFTLPRPAPDLARQLDMLAGIELQHGHHSAAEHLARQAAELRGQA